MKMKFKITGLDCVNCAAELEESIRKTEGIKDISISFMSERMIIEIEDSRKEEIMENIRRVIKKEEPDVTISEI